MRAINLIFFSSLFIISTNNITHASETRVGVFHYMDNLVSEGHFVCELQDSAAQNSKCYYVNDFSRTITPNNDTSGVMAAKSISKKQGPFIEVQLDQLATSVHPEDFATSQVFNFYMKLHWQGHSQKGMKIELNDSHVIKGRVVRQEGANLNIEIESIPDLFMLSTLMPSLDIAEVFGREAHNEAFELEHDIKLWISLVIDPVLKSYFNDEYSIDVNLP